MSGVKEPEVSSATLPYFRALWLFGLLLTTGCASTNINVRYDPVYDLEIGARSGQAGIARKAEKTLATDGYCKIGRIAVSCQLGDSQLGDASRQLESALIGAASRQGGDLVRIDTENVLSQKTEYKNGECLREKANNCIQYKQEPVFLSTLTTAGSVWRRDPELCRTLAGRVSHKRLSDKRRQ